MKQLTRFEKIGGTATSVVAVLVLIGYFEPIMGFIGIATATSVEAKIAASEQRTTEAIKSSSREIKDLILADKKDNVEFWINFLNFKSNRGEANDFDMTILAEKYRQREDLKGK